MIYPNLSALPRFFAAVLFVLLVSACDTTPPPISPEPPEPLPQESCSKSNNELELAEASREEQRLACLIIRLPEQEREEMNYHPVLGEIARARAADMAEYGYYGGADHGYPFPEHVDRHGYGPDHYLCKANYRPDLYCMEDPFSNTVESIGMGGDLKPRWILKAWLESSTGHREHILGQVGFETATYYGIGHGSIDETDPVSGVTIPVDFWVFIATLPPDP